MQKFNPPTAKCMLVPSLESTTTQQPIYKMHSAPPRTAELHAILTALYQGERKGALSSNYFAGRVVCRV
jgi:hypothetical protein